MSSTFRAGSETRIDTRLPDSHPSLVALADGSFVLAWQAVSPSRQTDGRNPYGADICLQHLDAQGVCETAAQRLGPLPNDQVEPSAAALPDGGFVVAYASQLDYDGRLRRYDFGVSSTGFDANGQPRDGVGTQSWSGPQPGDQDAPVAAVLRDGSVQVAWASSGSPEAGLPAGVATPFGFIAGAATPALAALAGGGLAAAWTLGGHVQVSTSAGSIMDLAAGSHPVLAGLADGSFVAAWEDAGDLRLAHLSAAGSMLGAPVAVTELDAGVQASPALAALPGGGFVAAWQSPDGDGDGIFYRTFDAQANAFGVSQQVNADSTGEQSQPTVAASWRGGFEIAWTSGEDVVARHYGLPLDWNGHEGMAWRLYQAAFDRLPDIGGLHYHTHSLDSGLTLNDVARQFIASPEFASRYGSPDDAAFVTELYANVLHRAPDAPGLAYHLEHLAQGWSRGDVLTGFSESPENQALVVGVFQASMPDL